MKNKITLFENKKDCCGCGACMNACLKHAISMRPDEYGTVFPNIDQNLCVACGLCTQVCMLHDVQKKTERNCQSVYAAMSRNEEDLKKSASGGIFKVIASKIIGMEGVVFGCALVDEMGTLVAKHIAVETEADLWKLQGSKYVQSEIGLSYVQAHMYLKQGRKVLFSGTPCQIDGLRYFLRGKQFDNLFTIDLICHGVPSGNMLKEYIKIMERRLNGQIENVCFRDKTEGWGYSGSLTYRDKQGARRRKKMPLQGFSYYKMFLDGDIFRENCYTCPFANLNRPGDVTIGDFWGIEEAHPEVLTENGGLMDAQRGISCIIVNTDAGKHLMQECEPDLILNKSSIEKVKRRNDQLNKPSKPGLRRGMYMEAYRNGGYEMLEVQYLKRYGIKGLLYRLWNYMPGKKI